MPLGDILRRAVSLLVALATLLASFGLAVPTRGAEPPKVAVIVGPVGEKLTPIYLSLAEAAATAAEERGATVARAYSPDASAENVLAAVEDANVVVYFGHGVGSPNPYSETPDPATTNGWGLNGPNAKGDHSDSWKNGTLTYYGESWIAEHARPAPGWVMIYSNACYAPGASEGFDDPATEEIAAERVSAYSRAPLADLGASAYFATDFYEGAAHLVGALLDQPSLPYGDLFATEPRFSPDSLVRLPHGSVEGAETWLHLSPYFEGKVDYWYAFAGDPAASLGLARAARRLRSSPCPISPRWPPRAFWSARPPATPRPRGTRASRPLRSHRLPGSAHRRSRPSCWCARNAASRFPWSTSVRATRVPPTSASSTCRTRPGRWSPTCPSRKA